MTSTVVILHEWPEAISDGLILPCSICNKRIVFDYVVRDSFWTKVAPDDHNRDAICLCCLDFLATGMGLDISKHLKSVQFTGIGKTIVLLPDTIYYYQLNLLDKAK